MYAKFHNDRLRNGWDITLWNFAKTRTNKQTHTHTHTHTQTNKHTDMGITIPRPPPMGGEVIKVYIIYSLHIIALIISFGQNTGVQNVFLPHGLYFFSLFSVLFLSFFHGFLPARGRKTDYIISMALTAIVGSFSWFWLFWPLKIIKG